ncbi:MAG: polyprenyl synthetase family protein [Bacilli bacterium]|nr:polyprenyl synthetase family protein [Bacilli bacterium]
MIEKFEKYLQHSLDECPDGVVKEASLYSLMNGGKRIRPRLLFATLQAYHCSVEKGFAAACAIEMMHSASLIHDDLPSMDNDTLRRGKPTCHIQYGEAMAILTGDALMIQCFKQANKATLDIHVNAKIVTELYEGSGLNGMIYGQEMDILNESKIIDDASILEKTHFYKTGKLITMPLVMAALIAKKDENVDLWREIGGMIGLLFQIQDDVFDVTKSSEELGKNANSDAENNKPTYVTLLGIERCNELIQELYDEAIKRIDTMMIDKTSIIEMLNYLLKRSN